MSAEGWDPHEYIRVLEGRKRMEKEARERSRSREEAEKEARERGFKVRKCLIFFLC